MQINGTVSIYSTVAHSSVFSENIDWGDINSAEGYMRPNKYSAPYIYQNENKKASELYGNGGHRNHKVT